MSGIQIREALGFFRYLLVWIAATVACLLGLVPTASLMLAVPGEIVLPLAMVLGALFAAIAANVVSNFLAPHQTRGRLLLIVGVAEIAGAVVAVCFLALVVAVGGLRSFMAPLIYPLLVSAGIIALSATVATGRLRTDEDTLGRDIWTSLGLIAFGLLMVIVVPVALCSTVISCIP